MNNDFNRIVLEYLESRRPFALATVIRVLGSASAKPGSKALIDEQGRNVHGWVGGGCAESLVKEEALAALAEGRTRIVEVDLDDEVLGVGMPCGGKMEVYIEPHLPPRTLLIVGHNKLARHLAMLGGLGGFSVAVHSPRAKPEHFPTAAVTATDWGELTIPDDALVVIATDHEGHLPALRKGLEARPAHLALVASRRVAAGLLKRLRSEGHSEEALARLHTPAGLDLGGETVEEISLSILAELLAGHRGGSALPLRGIKGALAGLPHQPSPPPESKAPPELLIVGQGRLAEELARLGTLLHWPVTVNTTEGDPPDLPDSVRRVTGDLDFSAMAVGPNTFVVIATLHKGDHLSMRRAMEGNAAYIGLIASQKRSGLVLDFLREGGIGPERMANVFAPAGLELGSVTPSEIALSVMAEAVAVRHGGSCRPLSLVEASAGSGNPDACRQLFE